MAKPVSNDPSYPPENEPVIRLIMRGDNYIYYRGRRIARVTYIPGKKQMWRATALEGKFAGLHTEQWPSKMAVLQAVWNHAWLDSLF